VTSELETYRFDRAAGALYHFIWHEYCDWYLELIKPVLQDPAHPDGPGTRQTLVETLETTMRLLHPFMPFITEEIWQTIPHQGDSIVLQNYPASDHTWSSPDAERQFALLEQTVGLIRTGRVLLNYPPGQHIPFFVGHDDLSRHEQLHQIRQHLAHLSRGEAVVTPSKDWPADKLLRLVTEGLSVGITVSGDVDLKKALDRLEKQLAENDKESLRLNGKLNNAEFVSKAPPDVITEHQERVRTMARDRELLAASAQQLRTMLGT
jgi:valyl-tRNA synthetase